MFAFAMTLQVTLLAERFVFSANQRLNVDVLNMVLETFACLEGTLLRFAVVRIGFVHLGVKDAYS